MILFNRMRLRWVLCSLFGFVSIGVLSYFRLAGVEKPLVPLLRLPRENPLSLSDPTRQHLIDTLMILPDRLASRDCRDEWKALIAVDWDPWANILPSGTIEIPGLANYPEFLEHMKGWSFKDRCQPLPPDSPIRKAQLVFLKSCGEMKEKIGQDNSKEEKTGGLSMTVQVCFRRFVEYQVTIINHLIGGAPLDQITDLGLLRNRYLFETVGGEPNVQNMFRTAQRMVAVKPHDARLLHLAVASAFSAWKNSFGDEAGQNAVLAKRYLELLAKEAPTDPELPGLDLQERLLAKDFDGLRRVSSLVEEQDPEAAVYYRAWAAYEEQRFQLAETILGDFLKTGPPHASFFQLALQNVQLRKPGYKAFDENFVALRRLGDRIGLDP